MEKIVHINYSKIENIKNYSSEIFFSAKPYPHIVVDDFLIEKSYNLILESIPAPRRGEKSSDYLFAKNKFENPIFDTASPILSELRSELVGERFTNFLSFIFNKKIFIDDSFVGGGLHQGGAGSFLDMHADFSRHPVHKEWVRELNILLYLNDGFENDWGGHLEMHNSVSGEKDRVAPIGNRLVVMLTKDFTLHGYKKISFPDGKLRTSIASYAYSYDTNFSATPDRSTLWKPDESGFLKGVVAKYSPFLVKIKRSLFGSSTAKRARRDQ